MSWILKRVSQHKSSGKKWIKTHLPFFIRPLYILTDPQTISEFHLKETDVAFRKNPQPEPPLLDLGMMHQFNERGLKIRGAFTEIFRAENVASITSNIAQIAEDIITGIKCQFSQSEKPGVRTD